MNICANNNIDHVRDELFPVLEVLSLSFLLCYRKITYNGTSHLKYFGKKDVFLKIAALTVAR